MTELQYKVCVIEIQRHFSIQLKYVVLNPFLCPDGSISLDHELTSNSSRWALCVIPEVCSWLVNWPSLGWAEDSKCCSTIFFRVYANGTSPLLSIPMVIPLVVHASR